MARSFKGWGRITIHTLLQIEEGATVLAQDPRSKLWYDAEIAGIASKQKAIVVFVTDGYRTMLDSASKILPKLQVSP